MSDFVERKAAIQAAEHAWDEWNLAMAAADGTREINLVYKRQELCKAVASVFDSAPAADVAPVVHGRWVNAGRGIKACSNCNHGIKEHMACANHYCPNCGAKMDGGVDHE